MFVMHVVQQPVDVMVFGFINDFQMKTSYFLD